MIPQKFKYQYTEETTYEIKEPEFGTFPVRKTANAWWNAIEEGFITHF